VLEHDSVPELLAFGQEVVHGKGAEKPVPKGAFFKVFGILDVVFVGGFIALNVDVEHGLDCLAVVVKGSQG